MCGPAAERMAACEPQRLRLNFGDEHAPISMRKSIGAHQPAHVSLRRSSLMVAHEYAPLRTQSSMGGCWAVTTNHDGNIALPKLVENHRMPCYLICIEPHVFGSGPVGRTGSLSGEADDPLPCCPLDKLSAESHGIPANIPQFMLCFHVTN